LKKSIIPSIFKGSLGLKYRDFGLNDEMKVELYAEGANQLLMRIENIADVFDSDGLVIHQIVDVRGIA